MSFLGEGSRRQARARRRGVGLLSVLAAALAASVGSVVPNASPAGAACSTSGLLGNTSQVDAIEAGVLGVLPGIVGSLQAVEAIKLILGLGDPLIGRLLAYDSLEQTFREYKVRVDPANEITYANRDRIQVVELDGLCMPAPLEAPAA